MDTYIYIFFSHPGEFLLIAIFTKKLDKSDLVGYNH